MSKKKPLIISIVGILNISLGVLILGLFAILMILSPISNKIQKVIFSNLGKYLFDIAVGIISLICGVGLLKLKSWGRRLFIYFTIFSLLYSIYGFCYKLLHPINYNGLWLSINLIIIILWIVAISFFSKESVKNIFK